MSLSLELADSNIPSEYTPLQPSDSSAGDVGVGKRKGRNITVGPVGVVLLGLLIALASFGGYHAFIALTSANNGKGEKEDSTVAFEINDEHLKESFQSFQAEMSSKKEGKKKHKSTEAPCDSNCELQQQIEDLNRTLELRLGPVEAVVESIIFELDKTTTLASANAYGLSTLKSEFESSPAAPDIPVFNYTYGDNTSNVQDLNTWDQCPFCTNWWIDHIFVAQILLTATGNVIFEVEARQFRVGDDDQACIRGQNSYVQPRSTAPGGRRRSMQLGDVQICTQCYRLRETKYGLRGYGGDTNYNTPLDFLIPYWNPNDVTDRTVQGSRNGDCPSAYFGSGGYKIYDYDAYVDFVENGNAITVRPKFACETPPYLTPEVYFPMKNWATCDTYIQPDPRWT